MARTAREVQKGFTSPAAPDPWRSRAGSSSSAPRAATSIIFNVCFRDESRVPRRSAFTATQIPGIETRKYPTSLAGELYPTESDFSRRRAPSAHREVPVRRRGVFAYSDVDYSYIGHRIALANAHGAEFLLLGAEETMLKAKVCPSSRCARSGREAGSSQTSAAVSRGSCGPRQEGRRGPHPMPYGDLASQAVERFATYEDLDKYETTLEEREEYEPHIDKGPVVYGGRRLRERSCGKRGRGRHPPVGRRNNDTPVPQAVACHIVVGGTRCCRATSSLRTIRERTNVRMADVIVINEGATPRRRRSVELVKQTSGA